MANRAYLYAQKRKKLEAISEYNYDIPIAYKILVSCKTRRVRSKIFRSPFKIALRGEFDRGVERLYVFLEELKQKGLCSETELDENIEETKKFLEKHRGCKFFWLEGAEVYELSAWLGSAWLGNLKMRRQVSRIEDEIQRFYQELNEMKPNERMRMLGIREWSDYLYYEDGMGEEE